jgi:hypothetical protein
MSYIIVVIIIMLIVIFIVALKVQRIAEMKGHNEKCYFHYSFWLGIIGTCYCLDRKIIPQKDDNFISYNNQPTSPVASKQLEKNNNIQQDDENKHTNQMVSIDEKGNVKCPKCNLEQNGDRNVCWNCGCRF